MRLKVVVVAAALVAGVPVLAHGAPSRSRAAVREAWARRHAELAQSLPADPTMLAAVRRAVLADVDEYSYMVPAGDLDGDHGNDFVDVREHDEFEGSGTQTLRLEAHRGRDGKALWSVSLPEAYYVYPLFTATGANGKPGMLVVSYTTRHAGTPAGPYAEAGEDEVDVTSYDGAGKQLWTKKVAGAIAMSDVSYNDASEAGIGGVGSFVAGGGSDVLVETWASAGVSDPTGTADEFRTQMSLGVIDGATGVERPIPGVAVVGDSFATYARAIGDADKDKLDDIAVVSTTDGRRGLALVGSVTGLTLSSPAGVPDGDYWEVRRQPDVTGDGVADLSVLARSFLFFPGSEQAPRAALVDAAKGKVAWTKSTDYVLAIGDADRHKGSEVVVATSGERGFTAAAYTGSGRRVWSASRSANEGAWTSNAGDVNGDGVTDLTYATYLGGRRAGGIVDGRTGRVVPEATQGMWSPLVAIDGHGADGVTISKGAGTATVTAWRGDRAQRLWQTTFSAPGSFWDLYGTYADADRCGDLVLTTQGGGSFTDTVVSGRNGAPMWALTRKGMAASKVTHPALRSARQYGKTC